MTRISRELPRLLERHDAITVGARDAAMRPACARAAAFSFPDEADQVTVYVPEATGGDVFVDLEANGAIAVVFDEIPTHHTIQVKGRVTRMRPAEERERPVVEHRVTEYFTQVEAFGGPPDVIRKRRWWPCRAVTFLVTDVFEQTPGPKAGTPLVLEAGR